MSEPDRRGRSDQRPRSVPAPRRSVAQHQAAARSERGSCRPTSSPTRYAAASRTAAASDSAVPELAEQLTIPRRWTSSPGGARRRRRVSLGSRRPASRRGRGQNTLSENPESGLAGLGAPSDVIVSSYQPKDAGEGTRCGAVPRCGAGDRPAVPTYGGMSGHLSGSAQRGRFDAPDAPAAIGPPWRQTRVSQVVSDIALRSSLQHAPGEKVLTAMAGTGSKRPSPQTIAKQAALSEAEVRGQLVELAKDWIRPAEQRRPRRQGALRIRSGGQHHLQCHSAVKDRPRATRPVRPEPRGRSRTPRIVVA